jgi:hypothetical protein
MSVVDRLAQRTRFLAEAARTIGRTQIAFALLASIVLLAYQFIVEWSYRITYQKIVFQLLREPVTVCTFAFVLTLGFVIADQPAPGRRRWPHVLVLLVGAATAGLVDAALTHAVFPKAGLEAVTRRGTYAFLDMLLIGSVGMFVYVDRGRARSAQTRLRAAEIDRAVAARRVAESRLQAMQARVEPAFLFNTIAQVKRLHEHDARRSKLMLDDLIAYLRVAMPQMRSTTSTLGQEIALAQAYLAIVAVASNDRLRCETNASEALASLPFPPMLILPLIEHALTHAGAAHECSRTIHIAARREEDRLCVAITDSGGGYAPGTEGVGMAGIRERLAALYGDRAGVALRGDAGTRTEAAVHIAWESVDAAKAAKRLPA